MPGSRPLRPGEIESIGAYHLVGLLGEGGQGTVYLAESTDGTPVAIKVLHARLVDDADARMRFLREIDLARRVAEFCTARVLDADVTHDRPYIVSEYVEGESLDQLVRREGPRDGGPLDRLAVSTVTALAAIHRAGIVHRDFKPSNVLLGTDGPRVIDFGIARMMDVAATMASKVQGTPSYMSPEQLQGWQPGPASDVFSWAVLMTFAATGHPAFGSDSIPAVMNRIMTREPDLTGVPERLRDLLAACLTKDARRRPSAGQALFALVERDGEATQPSEIPAAGRGGGKPDGTSAYVPEREGMSAHVPLASSQGAEPGARLVGPDARLVGPGERSADAGVGGRPVDAERGGGPGVAGAGGRPDGGGGAGGRPGERPGGGEAGGGSSGRTGVSGRGSRQDRRDGAGSSGIEVVPDGGSPGSPVDGGAPGATGSGETAAGSGETAASAGEAAQGLGGTGPGSGGTGPGSGGIASESGGIGPGSGGTASGSGGTAPSESGSGGAGGVTRPTRSRPPRGVLAVVSFGVAVAVAGGSFAVFSRERQPSVPRPGASGTTAAVVVVPSVGPGFGAPLGGPFTGRTTDVLAVAAAEVDGRPVTLSAGRDSVIRMSEAGTREASRRSFKVGTPYVSSLAVGQVKGRPVVVCGGFGGGVWVWDLTTGAMLGRPFRGHRGDVLAVAPFELDGRGVVVSGGHDGLRVSDAATGREVASPLRGKGGEITSVTVAALDGRPVVVSGGVDGTVRVWDPAGGRLLAGPYRDGGTAVATLAVGESAGRPVIVSGGDRTVRVRDLRTGRAVGQPWKGHTDRVVTLAVTKVDGRPVVVSGSWDRTVRVWDLATGTPLGHPLTGPAGWISSVAVTRVNDTPAVVAGTNDGEIWTWSLDPR
ncbi:serine/threonine-protein kinase [Sphaerisporangium corydalis]|uniref:Serine/threonine-protein kinase n=1 Tax=Sphaerisporangium corydalis TaxID=1441875 RepID=A0ABV9EV33_9ACTN|nr:serine/threonine-protein kinase [Sphaerisporangium corydalis]